MLTYQNYFFVQGEEADKWLSLLDTYGPHWLVREMDEAGLLAPVHLPDGAPDMCVFQGGLIGVPAKHEGDPYIISAGFDKQYLGIGKIVTEEDNGTA